MSTETESQSIIERLFSAGAHYGFSKSRRHPTAIPYLYGNKQGVDVFDLEKVVTSLQNASTLLEDAGKNGQSVLFVGTKDEISRIVQTEAERAEVPYVTNRWIGGMLTNFPQMKKRIDRLIYLVSEGEKGELERKYTKKERVMIGREIEKLTFNFGSVRTLEKPPQLMVVVDPRHDSIAVTEAKTLNIPVIGVMNSDSDASKVTVPVFVNDTLQSSVSLVLHELTDAFLKGRAAYTPAPARTTPSRAPATRR